MEFARRWLCLDASREKEADRIERSPAAVGDETRVVVMAWQPEAGTGWPGSREGRSARCGACATVPIRMPALAFRCLASAKGCGYAE